MVQGVILKAARRDNKGALVLFVVLVVLCGGVIAYNATFVYNFVAGPAPFTKALAAAPGMREFVRAEGDLVSTGSKEATVWRWLPKRGLGRAIAEASGRSLAEREKITANFMAMFIDGGVLIVKVTPDFSGRVVEGRLVPLPEELRAMEGRSAPATGDAADATASSAAAAAAATPVATASLIHPRMIDATSGYRSGINLFVLVAAPLLPLSLIGLAFAVQQWRDTTKHAAIARVAKHGPYMALLPRIERELAAAGEQAHIGPLWIGPNWLVVLAPTLQIFPIADVMGVGHESKTKKSGDKTTVTHWLSVWMRGEPVEDSLELAEHEIQRILPLLTARHPWILVEDTALVRKRWIMDQAACTREMDARRRDATAPPAATPAPAPAPARALA
jgi:hypothetical protein